MKTLLVSITETPGNTCTLHICPNANLEFWSCLCSAPGSVFKRVTSTAMFLVRELEELLVFLYESIHLGHTRTWFFFLCLSSALTLIMQMCLHGPVHYLLPTPEHQSPPPYQDAHANSERERENGKCDWVLPRLLIMCIWWVEAAILLFQQKERGKNAAKISLWVKNS